MEFFIGIAGLILALYLANAILERLDDLLQSISDSLRTIVPFVLVIFLTGYFLASDNSNSKYSYLYDQQQCTEEIISAVKIEIRKEYMQSNVFFNLQIAYFGMVGGWLFSMIPSSYFSSNKDRVSVNSKINLPEYIMGNETKEVRKTLTILNTIILISDNFSDIEYGKIIRTVQKILKIILIIIFPYIGLLSIERLLS